MKTRPQPLNLEEFIDFEMDYYDRYKSGKRTRRTHPQRPYKTELSPVV